MAINLICKKCHKTSKLNTPKCRCGNKLKENRSFKVRVRLLNGNWRSKTVSSLDLAKKIEAKFKTQAVEQNIFNIHKAPVIETVWAEYIQWAKHHKSSWKDDQSRWDLYIKDHLTGLKMDKITLQHVQAVLDRLYGNKTRRGTPYKPATIKQVLVLIKRVFNWSIKQRYYYGVNPCNPVEIPKFDNTVTNSLDRAGLRSLLDILDSWPNERAVLVIKFALYSGKRRGEILKLRWKDIDFETHYINFVATNTKSKTLQTLPLNQKCLDILRRCDQLMISDYVFPCSTGKYYSGFDKVWRHIRKKAGITIRFHDLRHTYASYLASSGKVDIYTLKELLGHSTIEMTQRYAHLINGALRKAACVADEVF